MKRRLLGTMTAAVVILAGATVAGTPATASDAPGFVCNLNQNTWLRTDPHGFVLRTLSAGRGFRWHGQAIDDGYSVWIYGHGAEAPGQDGWIPAVNANC